MTTKNINESEEIAIYYGFISTETPEIKKIDISNCKNMFFADDEDNVEEKASILRTYVEKKMDVLPQPVYLYFKGNFKNNFRKKTQSYSRYCDLEIVGDSKSIAEAILIQTAIIILANEGYKEICVEINSIGDKDSQARFAKELNQYYRKNINEVQPCCKESLKRDVFELLHCTNEKCHSLKMSAPKSITYLGETSREHFKEVLEYLEALNIPYRINNNLIGNKKYCSDTIFEIIDTSDGSKNKITLASGVRYDGLSKRLNFKKEVGGIGISLLIKRKSKEVKKKNKIKKPSLYFIQLGFEAKCQSLQVIEMLRQAKIPVYQSLGKDKMSAQMNVLDKLKVTHTLLMGKKETIEKSIIVRDMVKRSQETVLIKNLVAYLKKVKI
ncbi:MAG: His/Gly/Thr/Pro-type tRNA ligase C-terminal domain-containing protein [Patescibacteria group bacterium]